MSLDIVLTTYFRNGYRNTVGLNQFQLFVRVLVASNLDFLSHPSKTSNFQETFPVSISIWLIELAERQNSTAVSLFVPNGAAPMIGK